MKISRENTPYTTKEKFLSNGSNKTELISKLVEELRNERILTLRCRDDVDTDVMKQCLEHSVTAAVEVRAEDADILIMLTLITIWTNTTLSQLPLQMAIIA